MDCNTTVGTSSYNTVPNTSTTPLFQANPLVDSTIFPQTPQHHSLANLAYPFTQNQLFAQACTSQNYVINSDVPASDCKLPETSVARSTFTNPINGRNHYVPPEHYQKIMQQYVHGFVEPPTSSKLQQQENLMSVDFPNDTVMRNNAQFKTSTPAVTQFQAHAQDSNVSASAILCETFGLESMIPSVAHSKNLAVHTTTAGSLSDVMATTFAQKPAQISEITSLENTGEQNSYLNEPKLVINPVEDTLNNTNHRVNDVELATQREDSVNRTDETIQNEDNSNFDNVSNEISNNELAQTSNSDTTCTTTITNAGSADAVGLNPVTATETLGNAVEITSSKLETSGKDDNQITSTLIENREENLSTPNAENSLPNTSQRDDTLGTPVSSFTDSCKSSATSANENDQNRRTQELIKKQMNEIEKEISRRIQNKNVKKMNEAELTQLLNDHGFGGFVGGVAVEKDSSQVDEASIPYRPSTTLNEDSSSLRPTLEQLQSSFSPPSSFPSSVNNNTSTANSATILPNGFYDAFGNFIPQQQFYSAMMQMNPQLHQIGGHPMAESFPQSQAQNFGATLTGNGLGLHGPAAFLTSTVMPQQQQLAVSESSPIGSANQIDLAAAAANSAALRFGATIPTQQQQNIPYSMMGGGVAPQSFSAQMPFYANNFHPQQPFYRQHLPQQQPAQVMNSHFAVAPSENLSSPSLPYAAVSSPTMSGISNEMAAMLLQQLQQENPGLIENLVDQQQQRNRSNASASSATAISSNDISNSNANIASKSVVAATGILPAPPQPQSSVSRTAQQKNVQFSNVKNASVSVNSMNKDEENGWHELSKRHSVDGGTNFSTTNVTNNDNNNTSANSENKENGVEPVWLMRESYLKRLEREEKRNQELLREIASTSNDEGAKEYDSGGGTFSPLEDGTITAAGGVDGDVNETDKLLKNGESTDDPKSAKISAPNSKKEVMVHEPAVLIEGVLFRARYLGSTQLTTDGRPTKTSRMVQAQEAVARVKAPSGEFQPSTEIDLFISTEKIMVLNTDLQRISETDVRQDILMDHALRSISYIADIGDLVVLMARRVLQPVDAAAAATNDDEEDVDSSGGIVPNPRVVCHVFESEEASFIAQSIGQAFQVAYVEFLRANGIDDPAYLREIDYQEVLNSQELMGEELAIFARKETQKDVVIPKKVGEPLGVVVVESGWGSILPTVVVANMAPGGPASRSNQLNIGDQIIGINGISLVGLPLATAQQNIKNAKTSTAVRLTIVSTPPVVEVRIKRPNTKYQLGFSVQNGVICSLLRGGIAERGGIRVGHRIIEINQQSVVAVAHERIVNMLATATGEIHMKTMPTSMFRLLTGQEVPNYI